VQNGPPPPRHLDQGLARDFGRKVLEVILNGVINVEVVFTKVDGREAIVALGGNEPVDELQNGWVAAKDPVAAADLEAVGFTILRRGVEALGLPRPDVVRRANAAGLRAGLEDRTTRRHASGQPRHTAAQDNGHD
jgi:hypothetical protein